MSYLKTLNSTDVIVTPFTVHKQFSYTGFPPDSSTNSVFVVNGSNSTYPLSGNEEGTGSASLVYNSIKQLFYSNFLSGSNGQISEAATASFNPDGTITGPFYTTNYLNNIQSIDELRYFPTQSGNNLLSVLSIPSKLFGDYIKPGSFVTNLGGTGVEDDGQGNIVRTVAGPGTGDWRGNILYKEGLVIFLGEEGEGGTSTFFSPQWESSYTIYETQYKCTIRANEFNYSLNPSLLTTYGSGSVLSEGKATYKNFVTGSDFSPYVTTIGLYDDNQNLLAVGKLAQPLPTSQTTDTTILINLDR